MDSPPNPISAHMHSPPCLRSAQAFPLSAEAKRGLKSLPGLFPPLCFNREGDQGGEYVRQNIIIALTQTCTWKTKRYTEGISIILYIC